MIVGGQEIKVRKGQPEKIQKKVNVLDTLRDDLKSGEIPKLISSESDHQLGFENLGFGIFQNEQQDYRNRKQRYSYFREMAATEIINRGLEIISDDSTQINESGDVIDIQTNDENIRIKLVDLFERLDMNNELWSIFFETIKMGDNFYEVVVDDYEKPKKIIALKYMEPEKVKRVEKNNQLLYYTYVEEKLDEMTKEKKEENIFRYMPWQIIHFKIDSKEFKPYGVSLLNSAIRTFRRLSLLEDVMLTYRISRAPERRVFYLDVGQSSTTEAKRFVEQVKNQYRSQAFIDEDGNINKRAHILSTTSDIFIPVRSDSTGTRIETLQGGEALNNIDDMKYFKDKILRTMNIPPAYLGDETDRSRGSLSQLDIKFSKYVERIQAQIIRGLYKLCALELFFNKEKKDSLNNFKLALSKPSNIKEMTDIDFLNQKFSLVATVASVDMFSKEWILRKIMKFSDKEITDIITQKNLTAGPGGGGFEGGGPGGGGGPGAPGGEIGGGELPPVGSEGGPPGEIGGPATDEIPPEVQSTKEEEKNELLEQAVIRILGQDFILKNKDDFFSLMKALKEETKISKKKVKITEELSKLFSKKDIFDKNSNNIKSQIALREFRGLNFTDIRSMTLYEENGEEEKYIKRVIVLSE